MNYFKSFNAKKLSLENVYIIFGPTGTGKTTFSIALAKELNAEIINCDMAQIYSEIKIGTGQIKDEEKDCIEHHLFGFLTTPDFISVYDMRKKIEYLIELILAKNKMVLIVGGSSFCVYSLFFAPLNFYDKIDTTIKKASVFSSLGKGVDMMFSLKYKYKIIFFDFLVENKKIWLENVKKRINNFFFDGWLMEIEGLTSEWIEFLLKKKFIGYNELILYNSKKVLLNLDQIKDLIYFRTCQYGKKQRTFLRKMQRDFVLYQVPYIDYYF